MRNRARGARGGGAVPDGGPARIGILCGREYLEFRRAPKNAACKQLFAMVWQRPRGRGRPLPGPRRRGRLRARRTSLAGPPSSSGTLTRPGQSQECRAAGIPGMPSGQRRPCHATGGGPANKWPAPLPAVPPSRPRSGRAGLCRSPHLRRRHGQSLHFPYPAKRMHLHRVTQADDQTSLS